MAANLYSQAVTVVTQLASLPIFLIRWSPEQYGRWVVISAIPIYLTVADAGIITAAANLMTMHNARGEIDELRRVFKASLVVILMVVPTIATVIGIALLVCNFGIDRDQRSAVFALTLSSLLTVACGLFDAAYRSCGKYPKVAVFLANARVLEWLGSIAGLVVAGSLTGVAIGYLSGRTLAFGCMCLLAKRDIPHIQWHVARVSWPIIRRLLRAGTGFISFTLGNLLTLQGMVILVGSQLGGAAVALFASSRTLTRLLAQISVLAVKSSAPEVAALYGADKHVDLEKLSRRMVWIVMSMTVAGAIILMLFGPLILSVWSRGKLAFNGLVFQLLLASAVATAYWQIRSVRLTATNQHYLLSVIFMFASIAALLLAYLGTARFGLSAAAAGALFSELVMVGGTAYALYRVKSRVRAPRKVAGT